MTNTNKKEKVKIYREKDKYGGILEVQVLERNYKTPEDLIWLHVKRGKSKKNEVGITMKPWEAHSIIRGLFLAIDYIYDKYGLENFVARCSIKGCENKVYKKGKCRGHLALAIAKYISKQKVIFLGLSLTI